MNGIIINGVFTKLKKKEAYALWTIIGNNVHYDRPIEEKTNEKVLRAFYAHIDYFEPEK
jgi:hypothetical protein